jgi:hypothetical protein
MVQGTSSQAGSSYSPASTLLALQQFAAGKERNKESGCGVSVGVGVGIGVSVSVMDGGMVVGEAGAVAQAARTSINTTLKTFFFCIFSFYW